MKNKEFEKDLEELLKKHNCFIIAVKSEVLIKFMGKNNNVTDTEKSFMLTHK